MKENISKNSKKFSLADQQDFAFISKDFNPIHVDSLKARRLMYGRIVVHGVNIFLWALSEWAKAIKFSVEVLDLNVKFLKPVFLDEEASFQIKQESTSQIIFHIFQQQNVIDVTDNQFQLYPHYHTLFFVSRIAIIIINIIRCKLK